MVYSGRTVYQRLALIVRQARSSGVLRAALVAAISLALTVAVLAGPPPGERWSDMVWKSEPKWQSVPRPAPSAAPVSPYRSTLRVYNLPYQFAELTPAKPTAVANVVAHLPPGADLWVEGVKMVSEASKPSYDLVSPPLEVGKEHTYHTTVTWLEDGKWVTQKHSFLVRAGDFHCIEVVPVDAQAADKDVAASLAKLAAEDKKAAEIQKTCAVQDTIRLGSMGPPVKVTVSGKDVYLCCEGCKASALKNPDQTLKTAEKNKDKK